MWPRNVHPQCPEVKASTSWHKVPSTMQRGWLVRSEAELVPRKAVHLEKVPHPGKKKNKNRGQKTSRDVDYYVKMGPLNPWPRCMARKAMTIIHVNPIVRIILHTTNGERRNALKRKYSPFHPRKRFEGTQMTAEEEKAVHLT